MRFRGVRYRPGEDVVEITRDRIRRASGEGDVQTGHLRGRGWQQPFLNIAADSEVALQDHTIRDLEHQQNKENEPAPEMRIEFEHYEFSRFPSIAVAAGGKNQEHNTQSQKH